MKKEITEVKENKMTVQEIATKLELEIFGGGKGMGANVSGGYVSDLLSDVMGRAREGELWVTLQSHVNVAAIASLKELSAILLVNGIKPDQNMLEKAVEERIPVLGTGKSTYQITGLMYQLLEEG